MFDVMNAIGLTGLSCVYFAMLGIGIMYALIILITGGHDGAGEVDFGGDMDVGGMDVAGDMDVGGMDGTGDLTHISPVTLAGFVTAFGAFGIISQSVFGASPTASLVWASIGGLLVGVASHLAFYYVFIKPQGSSQFTRRDVVGARAEVVTPIPEGNVGEIAFVAQGARVTMTARSESGGSIARGTVVEVREQVGSVALVEPYVTKEEAGGADTDSADEVSGASAAGDSAPAQEIG